MGDTRKALILNRGDIAMLMSVSNNSILAWQDREVDPLPILKKAKKRGQANQYDAAAVVSWRIRQELSRLTVDEDGQPIDYEAERARLTKAQATAQEMKNDESMSRLCPLDIIEWTISSVLEQVVSVLESIPIKVKQRLPHMKASELEIIKREIIKARNIASKAKLKTDFPIDTGEKG